VVFNGERHGWSSTLNVSLAPYVCYFFKRRGVFVALGLIAAEFAATLVGHPAAATRSRRLAGRSRSARAAGDLGADRRRGVRDPDAGRSPLDAGPVIERLRESVTAVVTAAGEPPTISSAWSNSRRTVRRCASRCTRPTPRSTTPRGSAATHGDRPGGAAGAGGRRGLLGSLAGRRGRRACA
jgi:hypothetical protein